MKLIVATDEEGIIYYVPLEQVFLIDNSNDDFSAFKYIITFNRIQYDISKQDFQSIISAFNDTNDQQGHITLISLGEKV
jgi:hypothetical protein